MHLYNAGDAKCDLRDWLLDDDFELTFEKAWEDGPSESDCKALARSCRNLSRSSYDGYSDLDARDNSQSRFVRESNEDVIRLIKISL